MGCDVNDDTTTSEEVEQNIGEQINISKVNCYFTGKENRGETKRKWKQEKEEYIYVIFNLCPDITFFLVSFLIETFED